MNEMNPTRSRVNHHTSSRAESEIRRCTHARTHALAVWISELDRDALYIRLGFGCAVWEFGGEFVVVVSFILLRLGSHVSHPARARQERHGDDDDDRDGDGDGEHGGAAAPPGRVVLRARGGGCRRRRRGGGGRGAVVVLGAGEGGCGVGGRGVEGVAATGAVRGVAGLFEGQRVHPGALPLRVVRPRRAAQRLRLAQRDPQRLDPSGRLLPVPVARHRRRDGAGGRGRRRRRAGDHDVLGGVISQQRVVGDQQHELGGEGFAGVVGRRWRPCDGEVAADGVPGGSHDVPGGERDGAPPGVPLAPVQPPLLAAGLRRHRRHDRGILLPAGVLRVPRPGHGAGGLPIGDHRAGVARGSGAAGAGAVVAAAAAPPGGAVRVHGALRRRAGAARAVAQLGTPGVLPGAVAGAGDGARVRRRCGVLRGARAGEVAAGDVRLRRPQPPDLPRARARRRAHALRRHRDPHRLARGGDRHRRCGIFVKGVVLAIDYSFIFMYVTQVILWTLTYQKFVVLKL